ncbi:hypothetical protein GOP47_0015300 [Adiantum capillus-veneris]|uniref:Uncharacterized protein n=1 Tax=Adiantum capillus-veneris TaxID=13818 RepID=A0A9D4UK56_ADICA|nr:hypothetical protein GOP47_0015300 [Adiantum capillus-veneris]
MANEEEAIEKENLSHVPNMPIREDIEKEAIYALNIMANQEQLGSVQDGGGQHEYIQEGYNLL